MQLMVYFCQNCAWIALKFRILKAKQCCESSSERLQWKWMIFYASDTFLMQFYHFGVLLYSMRQNKKGSVSKSGLLLGFHTFPLPHHLFFCLKLLGSPCSIPLGSDTKNNLRFPIKVPCWGWPPHLPPRAAQQPLSSSETATNHAACTGVALDLHACARAVWQSGSCSTCGLFPLRWKARLEIQGWLPYLCSVILHMSDSTRSLTEASGILQSLTFTRQQFTVVELTTYP